GPSRLVGHLGRPARAVSGHPRLTRRLTRRPTWPAASLPGDAAGQLGPHPVSQRHETRLPVRSGAMKLLFIALAKTIRGLRAGRTWPELGDRRMRKSTRCSRAAAALVRAFHKAWMPRSCRSRCMVAASTSYEAHADPVPAVTTVRHRPCGTTHTAAHGAKPVQVQKKLKWHR